MSINIDVNRMLTILTDRTVKFFAEELEIKAEPEAFALQDVKKLTLKYLTSIMNVGGNIEMYLAFSFDENLITKAFESYSSELDIDEDERDEYLEETAGDIINIIIGNSLGEISKDGPVVSLSPPIIISEAKSVFRHKHAQFYSAHLSTPHGGMSIHCIGPRELFDPLLNYVDGGADA